MAHIRTPAFFRLTEAFGGTGCPLCSVLAEVRAQYLRLYLYEYATDPAVQIAFAEGGGFCGEHSRELRRFHGHSANLATLYERALGTALEDRALWQPDRPRRRREPSAAPQCACCEVLRRETDALLGALENALAHTESAARFRGGPGLCLPHYRLALEHVPAGSARTLLQAVQRAGMAALQRDLDRFLARTGERAAGEALGDEGNAWKRAVDVFVGLEGVLPADMR